MQRKDFIKNCGLACISGTAFIALLQSCSSINPIHFAKTDLANNQLNIKNKMLLGNIKDNKTFLAKSYVDDLKSNLQHIYLLGKDADGIVKKVLAETRKIKG